MKTVMAYLWPGNVRELANVLERSQILAENHLITVEDLPENIISTATAAVETPGDPNHLSEVERLHMCGVSCSRRRATRSTLPAFSASAAAPSIG
jgi:transcriptional regulator of acetoin/glycerol metabolism